MINLVDARLLKGHLSYAVMPYFPDSTRAASGEILLPHQSYMHISRSKFTLQKSLLEDGNGAAAAPSVCPRSLWRNSETPFKFCQSGQLSVKSGPLWDDFYAGKLTAKEGQRAIIL